MHNAFLEKMEKIAEIVEECATTICLLLGGRVPREEDESFFRALEVVLEAATGHRPYRPTLLYHILVFFFGHRRAHMIVVRFREFCSRRRIA